MTTKKKKKKKKKKLGCASSSLCDQFPPWVVIDNLSSPTATLIRVERRRKHMILLDVVQIISDLNLSILKGFISSDSGSFIDVFHVTDQEGRKLNGTIISYILQAVGNRSPQMSEDDQDLMELELRGTEQPGLLLEVFTGIADLQGNVVDAKVWTHNGRYALLIYFKYEDYSGSSLSDSQRGDRIVTQLKKVLKGDHKIQAGKIQKPMCVANTERRLHQLLFADRDYDRSRSSGSGSAEPIVSVEDSWVRGYTVVNVACKDRQKLFFDIVCTLTDMKYVIFHATMGSDCCSQASLELYIRNQDGSPIISEAETQHLIKSLQAAIQRRVFEGLIFELEAPDRRGLLADVTHTLKDNGLNVTGADVSSVNKKAANLFYVTPHVAGRPVEATVIEEAVKNKIGTSRLKLKMRSHERLSKIPSRSK